MHGASVVLTALLTSVVTTVGGVYLVERYNVLQTNAPVVVETTIPDLRTVSEHDALASANATHIGIFVASREPSAAAKPGTVLRQSLVPGVRVPRDTVVSVVLAEEIPTVPSITGLKTEDANTALERAGYHLQLGRSLPDNTAATGTVLTQAPKASSAYAKGGSVTVDVSAGPAALEVPKLIGTGVNSATKKLEALGFKVKMRWVSLAETATFVVLNQKPAAGEKAPAGSEIELTACQ